jgi:hypothetical protein
VEWPVGTTSQPPGGVNRDWAAAMMARDCAAIGRLGPTAYRPIYAGLETACTEVHDPRGRLWPSARAAADTFMTSPGDVPRCEELAAQRLLELLVNAQQSNPIRIEIRDPDPNQSVCDYARKPAAQRTRQPTTG